MATWVALLAPWDSYFTNTFRWPASEDSTRRLWTRWIAKQQPGVPVIYGIDPNPSGDGGHHVHALLASSGGLYRKDAWTDWFSHYGVARIVPVDSIGGVSGYIAKYPLTGARHWDVFNCGQLALSNGCQHKQIPNRSPQAEPGVSVGNLICAGDAAGPGKGKRTSKTKCA
jgi:hypothetical protein